MRTMALDYGDRFVGIAVTDEEGRIALRHGEADQKSEKAPKKIAGIVREEKIKRVLVGVPLGLEGDETEQTHKSLEFMEELRGGLPEGVEVEGIDEVFTTKEAKRLLEVEGKGADSDHSEAARLMLESYLKGQEAGI